MSAEIPQNTEVAKEPIKTVVAGVEIIKRLNLQTEGAWVDVLTNAKSDQLEDGAGETLVAYLIRAWNFADEAGNILPITEANCDKALSLVDKRKILDFVGFTELLSDSKKND